MIFFYSYGSFRFILLGSRVEICRRLCFCNSSKSFCCAQVPSCLVRMTSIHNQNDCNHVWGKGLTESEEPRAVDRYAVRKSCCNSETFVQQICQVSSSLTLFCRLMGVLSWCPHFQYFLYLVYMVYIFLQFLKISLWGEWLGEGRDFCGNFFWVNMWDEKMFKVDFPM